MESFWWMLVCSPRMCTCVLQFIAVIPEPVLLWMVQSINLALAAQAQLIPVPVPTVCKISHCTAYNLARDPRTDIPVPMQRWKRQFEVTTLVLSVRNFPHTINPLPQGFEMQRLWKPMPVFPATKNPPLIVVLFGPCPMNTISSQLMELLLLGDMSKTPLPSKIRKGTPGLLSRWLSVHAQFIASSTLQQSSGTDIFLNFTTSCHSALKNGWVGRRKDLSFKFINLPQIMSRHTSYGIFNQVSIFLFLNLFVAAEDCPFLIFGGLCCASICVWRGGGRGPCLFTSSEYISDVFLCITTLAILLLPSIATIAFVEVFYVSFVLLLYSINCSPHGLNCSPHGRGKWKSCSIQWFSNIWDNWFLLRFE